MPCWPQMAASRLILIRRSGCGPGPCAPCRGSSKCRASTACTSLSPSPRGPMDESPSFQRLRRRRLRPEDRAARCGPAGRGSEDHGDRQELWSPRPARTEIIDARGWFLYPGLVNTHHHFFQTFVRNRADLDWTKLSVIEWLDLIYPIFSRLTEDCFYHSSLTAMAELAKHGCTTAFDHQYNFPRHAGKRIVDRQFRGGSEDRLALSRRARRQYAAEIRRLDHPGRDAGDDRRIHRRLRAADRQLPRSRPPSAWRRSWCPPASR